MLRVWVGWDERDALAYEVCRRSLLRHASIPVEVAPLKHWELRRQGAFWRGHVTMGDGQMYDCRDGKPFSTTFAFTRFAVPQLAGWCEEPVLFCDADMLWRADVAELLALMPAGAAVACVKHDHQPAEVEKMGGVVQTLYARKNWSSLMVMRPAKCRALTAYAVNNWRGSDLHAMVWADDGEIAGLPECWNFLEGWSDPAIEPKVVHYTRGTPDFPGCEEVAFAEEWWSYAKEV